MVKLEAKQESRARPKERLPKLSRRPEPTSARELWRYGGTVACEARGNRQGRRQGKAGTE